jgi:Fe-S oxidoreductase
MLLEEFIERYWTGHPVVPRPAQTSDRPVALHGHCHQKALWGDGTTSAVLRRLVGQRLTVLPSGCCGMAGAFGMMASKAALSRAVATPLVDAIAALPEGTRVVACGTSCRQQIRHLTDVRPLHMAELLAAHLG